MAGRPPIDPELVAEALRRIEAGKHRDDVAAELAAEGRPISVATIRRAQAALKGAGAPATGKRTSAGRKPASRAARPARATVAKAPAPPPPAPIPLLPDALDELRTALEQTKGHLAALAGKQGYSAAGNLYDKLLKTKAALERERLKPGQELSHILGQGKTAVAKIRAGAATYAAQEAATGKCCRCGGPLRKAEEAA